MNSIAFATTNTEKILTATMLAGQVGIDLDIVTLEVDEIQGEDAVRIATDKAERAYALYGKPLVVSDDSWSIPALNGFPGPYMKSINHWFAPDDLLRLMQGVKDRTIILQQYLAYHDGDTITVFNNDVRGIVIEESRGHNAKSPTMSVIALDGDNGRTIAEVFEQGDEAVVERYASRPDVWHEFLDWYTENPTR